ncbi:MAG: NusA-like transcription termination signal-binding factor [Nanoarchaeota archaeon]|nr:NusA-like transcription termination signal-binding factor [Nanoarchaeota archaeon]
MREFDTEMIGLISAFETMTKTEVRDCISNDVIYFLVNSGKAAIAIGKGGETIKKAERALKKQIKLFEWNEEDKAFIKNMIPQAQTIVLNSGKAQVTLLAKDRGAVFGKGGSNIKIIRELLSRNSDVKELKVV